MNFLKIQNDERLPFSSAGEHVCLCGAMYSGWRHALTSWLRHSTSSTVSECREVQSQSAGPGYYNAACMTGVIARRRDETLAASLATRDVGLTSNQLYVHLNVRSHGTWWCAAARLCAASRGVNGPLHRRRPARRTTVAPWCTAGCRDWDGERDCERWRHSFELIDVTPSVVDVLLAYCVHQKARKHHVDDLTHCTHRWINTTVVHIYTTRNARGTASCSLRGLAVPPFAKSSE